MKYLNFILIVLLGSAIFSCAVQKSPLGGPKDEDPPVLDTLRSTPNFQTRFQDVQIILYFDEFVQLKNIFEQVVYSPPLGVKPEVIQRGKKIKMKFSEEDTLRSNTTYTINFGDAIQDFNESNILENFRFVFSTGDVIDSLAISGNVVEDETKKPAEEVLVLLYDQLDDSIVYKEQPYYFAKTSKSGNFQMQNLRSDTFKLIVLQDENLNLKYDEGEKIGFLDSFIFVNDSLPGLLDLRIFQPLLRLQLMDEEQLAFKFKMEFNRSPYNIEIRNSLDSIWWQEEIVKDSIILWHNNTIAQDTFILFSEGEILDTLVYKKRNPKASIPNIAVREKNTNSRNILPTGQGFILNFEYPISGIDTTLITFSDTLPLTEYQWSIDTSNSRALTFDYDYKFGDTLKLNVLPGAINFLNEAVHDTIEATIIPDNPENYGQISLQIDSLDQELNYLMQLLDGEKIISQRTIFMKNSETFSFVNLPPKSYAVKLIIDENGNGRWDPGSYEKKLPSEIWQNFNLEALRENWELESKIEWIK